MRDKNLLKLIMALYLFLVPKAQAQIDLDFMAFNIWQEGTSVSNGLTKIKNIIVEVNPDVVGFSEVRNYNGQDWTAKIVDELSSEGLQYHRGYAGGDVSVISKFPIQDFYLIPGSGGSIAGFHLDINGEIIIVACGHLDYMYYACYLPRGYNGGSPNWNMIDDGTGNPDPVTDVSQILSYNLLSTKDEQVNAFLNYTENKTEPVVFMGDFNDPSHLDWTANTSAMFDHNGVVVPWQNTMLLEDSGYTDSYREFFPNEVDNPGITWPSYAHGKGSTSWTPLADDRDRIDYIFYKGGDIQTKYAALVGPRESYANNEISTTFTANEHFIADSLEWPSDHKAVFATLTFPHITKVNEFGHSDMIKNFSLGNNYPNPFNSSTTISYSMKKSSHVSLNIYNVHGRIIDTLINEYQFADTYFVHFDANNYTSGIYFYKLCIGNEFVETKKFSLIR
ncbi:endonuclease/exonuclease/phosphatase family protein [candidate division KSB1 bacterium]|nr:endonuclease/exonuclease/phosphatase family protein [candidate division KSB1 bacterium]